MIRGGMFGSPMLERRHLNPSMPPMFTGPQLRNKKRGPRGEFVIRKKGDDMVRSYIHRSKYAYRSKQESHANP